MIKVGTQSKRIRCTFDFADKLLCSERQSSRSLENEVCMFS